jgi:hypothetical protein
VNVIAQGVEVAVGTISGVDVAVRVEVAVPVGRTGVDEAVAVAIAVFV